MPMLTVCPRAPDLNSILFSLLDDEDLYASVVTDEVIRRTEETLYQEHVQVVTGLITTSTPIQDSTAFFDQVGREP